MGELLSGLIDVELRRTGEKTLISQLYDRLRGAILDGALPPGFRLPSSRDLARDLKVSRNTVSFVVDQLAMEGYLDITRGRRPIVSAASKTELVSGSRHPGRSSATLRISHWATRLRKADWPIVDRSIPRPFVPGLADARAFPHDVWARCLRR